MSPIKLFGKKSKEWFIRNASKDVSGPFNDQQLKDKATDGSLSPEDKVSNDQKKWTSASRAKLLKGLFDEGKPVTAASAPFDLPTPQPVTEPETPADVVVTEQAGDAMEVLLQDDAEPQPIDDAVTVKPLSLPTIDADKVAPTLKPQVEPAAKVTAVEDKKKTPAATPVVINQSPDTPIATVKPVEPKGDTPAVKAPPQTGDAPTAKKKDLPAAKPTQGPKADKPTLKPAQSKDAAKQTTPKGPGPKLKPLDKKASTDKPNIKTDKKAPTPSSKKPAPAPKEQPKPAKKKEEESKSPRRKLKGNKPKPAPAVEETPAPKEAPAEEKTAKAQAPAKKEAPKKSSAPTTSTDTTPPAEQPVATTTTKKKETPAAPIASSKPRAESNTIIELERQIEDLSAQVENAQDQANRDKRSLSTKVDVLESKLQAIKDREAAIQRDHEHDKNKLKRETEAVVRKLTSVSEDLEARKQQLFTLRNDSRDEVQALRTSNAEIKAENEALQNALKDEQELMTELRRVHHLLSTTSEQEKTKLAEKISHLQDNAGSSATILEGAWHQLEKQKAEIADMFTKDEVTRREAGLKDETERARNEAAGISVRLEQHKAQASKREDTLVQKLAEKDNAVADLESRLSKASSDIDEHRKQEALLTSKAEDLDQSINELERKLTESTTAHSKQTEALANEADARKQADKKIEGLTKELDDARQALAKTEKAKAELGKELDHTRSALNEAEQAGQELANTLSAQINDIRTELVAQSDASQANRTGALADADIKRLKQRILDLRSDAENAVTLTAETEQLRSSLEEVETKSKTFKRDLSEAEEKYMILEQKLVLTESRETRLIKRLDQVESLMKLLRAQME